MPKIIRKKNYHYHILNKKKIRKEKNQIEHSTIAKKKKNFKFIQRNKEAEELQRRQKIVEDKYRNQNRRTFDVNKFDHVEFQDDINPLDQLLTTFQTEEESMKNQAIESSSDEEQLTEDDPSEQNMNEEDFEEESVSEEENTDDTKKHNKKRALDERKDINKNNKSYWESNNSDTEISLPDREDSYHGNHELEENFNEINDNAIKIHEHQTDNEIYKQDNDNQSYFEDTFHMHLENNLFQDHLDNLLQKQPVYRKSNLVWPRLKNLNIEIPTKNISTGSIKMKTKKKNILLEDEEIFASEGRNPKLISLKSDISYLYIKNPLLSNLKEKSFELDDFELELFSILNNYQDLYYSHRNFKNCENIRKMYCLHALNHMLKTRAKILHHNAKISLNKTKLKGPVLDTYRDQGLIRPKILIILPFRESVYRTVNIFIKLFFGKKADDAKNDGSVINYNRFLEEYTGDTIRFPKTNPKPDDYEKIFSGNTDDTFRMGISLTKKCIKLYSEFYSSDIILASPLGLRMIIGAPGENNRDYDFLNSIEILVLDQLELFFAQNWDHVLHVMDHMHLQPQSLKNTDCSRVRLWSLNGLSKFYRQTLLFSSHELPEFRSIFNSKCSNYRGKIKVCNAINIGTIRNVFVPIPQIFHKIEVQSVQSSFECRFEYFTKEILPQYKSSSMAHCMVYIPSYFDYVRIRNYLKAECVNFVQICEYSKDEKIARARDMFFHSASHFLLYSERAHFFRRTRIKGIRHLIMYQPPYWPNFYSEIINLMQDGYQNSRDGLESSMSITILYTKYDMLQISGIIGTRRANDMLQSGKQTYMFLTGEN